MKIWVETDIIGAGTDADPKRPDLSPHDRDPELGYSMMDKGDGTCLARVSGPQLKIGGLTATKPNDTEAGTIITAKYPNFNLVNVDVPDSELDSIAEGLGIDPLDVRKNAPITTTTALQSQECALFEEVAGREVVDISAHLDGIKGGRCDECENALVKLR